MDSYQPEGVPFPRHRLEASLGLGVEDRREEELDEGDIVKSKPKGKASSGNPYLPLVNEGGAGSVREAGAIEQAASSPGYVPPNGRIPAVQSILPDIKPTLVSASPGSAAATLSSALASTATATATTMEVGGATVTATATRRGGREPASLSDEEEEEEGNEEEQERAGLLEESTTALIRRYTMQRNGRPTSIHFGPSGEIVGSGWLSEILMTNHKKCSVTLEEDSITWRFLSRKDGEFVLADFSVCLN